MAAFAPTIARLADAVVELRACGVAYRAIADGLECTENYARQLSFRAKGERARRHGAPASLDWWLLQEPTRRQLDSLRRSLSVRPGEDAVVLTRRDQARLDDWRQAIAVVWAECRPAFRCDEAIRRLRRLRERIGFAASHERLRVRGELAAALAFFAVHSGRTTTAVRAGTEAAFLFWFAYREAEDDEDLWRLAKVAELIAHAHSLAGQPEAVLATIGTVDSIYARLGRSAGPNGYRLRGVARFQQGPAYDAEARQAFARSMALTRDVGHLDDSQGPFPSFAGDVASRSVSAMDVEMNGSRHIYALTGDPEAAIDLHHRAVQHFGPMSLQGSMTAHWAAVAGLVSDDRRHQDTALDYVERNRPVAGQFGHQASIAALLRSTPRLRLSRSQRVRWGRYCLYANAFRRD